MTENESKTISLMFILIPALFVIIGIFFFPQKIEGMLVTATSIVVFSSLILLVIGTFCKNNKTASGFKLTGWVVIAFFWSTQINSLYYGEEGDLVNAFICAAGVFFLCYIAYHEWLSLIRNEKINFLYWVSGASAIAGIIYFGFELTPLEVWLREIVAIQSGEMLNFFTDGVQIVSIPEGSPRLHILYKQAHVYLIFACTAVQSMVVFAGMIIPLKTVDVKRKIIGLSVTIVPVYLLNLVRNALVVFLVGDGITDFYMAHNVIAKAGGLVALILLLFLLIKIIPEVFDEIFELFNLHKRDGPLEKIMKKIWRSK